MLYPFHMVQAVHIRRSMVHMGGTLACFVTSLKTAGAAGLARVPCECRLCVGGHSFHVVLRSCTERERPPAGAVPFHSA